jgi:hypothetical protein
MGAKQFQATAIVPICVFIYKTRSRMAPNDPNFESIKRQVQMGLFATLGQRRDD